jgi:hypothetical protein
METLTFSSQCNGIEVPLEAVPSLQVELAYTNLVVAEGEAELPTLGETKVIEITNAEV